MFQDLKGYDLYLYKIFVNCTNTLSYHNELSLNDSYRSHFILTDFINYCVHFETVSKTVYNATFRLKTEFWTLNLKSLSMIFHACDILRNQPKIVRNSPCVFIVNKQQIISKLYRSKFQWLMPIHGSFIHHNYLWTIAYTAKASFLQLTSTKK